MSKIDDNTLAAYLEGTLPDEEREWVEQAIEEDEESQAVVDEWIAMADDFCVENAIEDDSELRMEACRTIGEVMNRVKRESEYDQVAVRAAMIAPGKQRTVAAKPTIIEMFTVRRVLVAASLLAFVSVTVIWLLNGSNDGVPPSFDVPMSGDYMACPPEDTIDADSTMQFNDYSEL